MSDDVSSLAWSQALGGVAGDEPRAADARPEHSSFTGVYRAHYPAIVGYLYRRVGDAHTAEDLAAETFIRAMRSYERFKPERGPVRSWLLRIATNEAHRRARRERRSAGRPAAGPEPATSTPDRDSDRLIIVQRAFLALPAKWQDVLALHHLEHLGVEQVALVLNCRAGTVKSRLSRAREALRRELERRRYTHDSQ